MKPLVVLLCLSVWEVSGKVDHAELRGEHPDQDDIDNGECIPIPCVMRVPPKECQRLCNLRNYETICQPPADFCLCRHMVHGEMTLVSPDEVFDQPPDSSEVANHPQELSKVKPVEQSKAIDQLHEQSETESDDGVHSFQIFTIFLPIKQFFFESGTYEENSIPEPTADTLTLGYETVNVHEGRLFWDFRYILTGLLLLMIGLVVYELFMCAMQVYRSKRDVSVKSEVPEVKVKSSFTENEKILKV